MKRRPQDWKERFARSMETHPSPALEDWRWAREGEGGVDARAVDAAWDLVTLHASAEAAKLHHAMGLLEGPLRQTLLPALVVAAARWTEVGTLKVVDADGKAWWPRDLSFVPGRDHLEPDMTIECGRELGRSVLDFVISYGHTVYVANPEDEADLWPVRRERSLALLLDSDMGGRQQARDQRARDLEIQQEGLLVIHVSRSELWQDPIGTADEALRTLCESTRFDAEQAAMETHAAP